MAIDTAIELRAVAGVGPPGVLFGVTPDDAPDAFYLATIGNGYLPAGPPPEITAPPASRARYRSRSRTVSRQS